MLDERVGGRELRGWKRHVLIGFGSIVVIEIYVEVGTVDKHLIFIIILAYSLLF